MLQYGRIWILSTAIILVTFFTSSCSGGFGPAKTQCEKAHGLKLPPSATNFQQKSWGFFTDRGVASLFELDQNDIQAFTGQLRIKSRNGPAKSGPGNPCINGYNVWPTTSRTSVPGNVADFKRTWKGDAVPVEMLSCDSPKGDWLHVEVWSLSNRALIKLHTDWN